MFKKTLVLGSLVVSMCSTPTLAQSNFYKSGFLVGAHLGTSFGSGSFNSIYIPDAVTQPGTVSGKARKESMLFGIFGGYRHIFYGGYTIGMDLSANFLTNNEINKELTNFIDPASSFANRISRQYSFVPSINFGKIICNRFHAYFGLGLAVSRFKQKLAFIELPNLEIESFNTSQSKLGFVPTIGVEYAVTHNISILGNASYEIYKKIKKSFSPIIGVASSSYASSISPRYLTLKFSIAYRF